LPRVARARMVRVEGESPRDGTLRRARERG
jgi:hypothetical protein